jgi:hypothetical protein
MRARRSATVLLVTGVTCLAGAAFPMLAASADGEPGSGLGSFNLSANAPVGLVREDLPSYQCSAPPTLSGSAACEGVINETVSTLRNGPIGHALSGVVWPGTLGGNAGSLLVLLGSSGQLPVPIPLPLPVPISIPLPPVPDQATMLNDPIKAENSISGKEATVVNSPVPGTTMTATATPTNVAATATIGVSQTAPVGALGTIHSQSRTTLTGPKSAEAVAHSEVTNIDIAGVIHLGAIVSDAKATTDGTHAVASGQTTIAGATIAGVPVTIDQRGVTVLTQNLPLLPSVATDLVNSTLKQAGITLAVSTASGTPDGASVNFDAGSLIVGIKQPATLAGQALGGFLTIELGGANVSVTSTPGYDFGSFTPNIPPYTGDTGGTAVSPPVSGTPPPATGTSGPPVGLGTGSVPPPTTAGGPVPIAAAPAAARLRLPHGLSPWLGALALLGAGLVMAGLRGLPDRVLVVPASACPQGDLA